MKIAYVTINVASNIMMGGVGAKIKRHVSLWKEMGHEARIFSLAPENVPMPDSEQFVFASLTKLPILKFLTLEFSRSHTLRRMIKAIEEHNPDIIYLRFGLYTFPLHGLFKIAPVILEVNSNDLDEYFVLRGYFFYWLNRITRNITFSLSSGLVPVSRELAQLNSNFKKPYRITSNGIDLDAYEGMVPPSNRTPVLTIIGSPGMSWHGMDKLLPLAERFPDLTINIIGYGPQDFSEPIPANIIAHGYLDQTAIKEILAKTDVVFGTLALHRKNMEEVPPLKVREALAFGIPVIVAYTDTDLQHLDLPTVLRIPNTEENVLDGAETIRQFAYDMMGRRVDIDAVKPYIDQRAKEEQRLVFFTEILARSKGQ
jgi:glycosyltransferase involved in cell wall biosynthesis